MLRTIIMLLGAMTLTQCSQKQAVDEIPSLLPLEESSDVSDLSPHVERMEFIPLENSEDSFLSYIKKILIDKKGNFIIADMSGVVRVFGPAGGFLFNVGRVGRGPGEYLSARDISLDNTGDRLLVMSVDNVLEYNVADGKFIRQIETPKRDFEAICASGEGGFFLFSSNPGPQDLANFDTSFFALSRFSADGSPEGEFLPRKDFVLGQGIFTQSCDGSYFLRPQEGDNILYKIAGNEITPKYHIDFGNKAIPARYMFEGGGDPWGNISKFIAADYHKLPLYFHDTADALYFSSIGPKGNAHHFLYLTPTRAIHWADTMPDKMPTLVMASDKANFYAMVVGLEIVLETNEAELNPLTRAIIKEFKRQNIAWRTDNPVLVKMQFTL